jgi:hypothetical protein
MSKLGYGPLLVIVLVGSATLGVAVFAVAMAGMLLHGAG